MRSLKTKSAVAYEVYCHITQPWVSGQNQASYKGPGVSSPTVVQIHLAALR